ncbi:hypothetical protein [uncultured Treponema sp.]|uniref:hypothetical protein n=1 Tax=uncultured Treponema sp. TaxID=162155 RepID=UPI002592154F|nr:hypothetical protein [uncultured Treponema sp.]
MKSTRLSLLRAKAVLFALVSVLAFSFSACNVTTEPEVEHVYKQIDADDLLVGTWTGGSTEWPESYTITNTTFESKGSYKGDNLVVQKLDSTSGYIYIKYTVAMNADWSYSETAPDVGKWYAISYKDLGAEKISISGAYKDGGATSCKTLDEAVTEFTVDNGYFGTYSSCTRQKSE